jgi:phospholipase A1/A2
MRPIFPACRLAVVPLMLVSPLMAQDLPGVDPATPEACVGIAADAARLECYDRAMGRERPQPGAAPVAELAAAPAVDEIDSAAVWPGWRRNEAERELPRRNVALSPLDLRWELSDDAKLGSFNLRAYKPVYLMPALWSARVNSMPSSPNPDNSLDRALDLQPIEAKFQLSLKTKVAQGLFFGEGDLWFGYTQSSRWQVFNNRTSRPFRETVYEPEAMLVFDGRLELPGWDLRMLSFGLNHQSNGQSLPLSRSWNRVMAQAAFEREGWVLFLRPWWRITEEAEDDDNRDIADFLGRGDLTLVHRRGDQEFALLARHSLRSGERSRGAWQFDWSFPLNRSLRGHVQVFDGYGESLINYNHRSTALGLGISFFEWL